MSESILDRLKRRVVAKGGQVLVLDDDRVRIVRAGLEHGADLDLTTLRWLSERGSAQDASAWLDERIAVALTAIEGNSRVGAVLLPRLRPPSEAASGPWQTDLVAGHLTLCLVEDRDETVRLLGPMEVAALPMGLAAARRRACARLYDLAPAGRWTRWAGGHRSVVGDSHDAARALIAHRWFPDPSGLFVVMPHRDCVALVAASSDEAFETALALRALVRPLALDAAYPISGELFWQHQGTLVHLPVERVDGEIRFADLPPALARLREP